MENSKTLLGVQYVKLHRMEPTRSVLDIMILSGHRLTTDIIHGTKKQIQKELSTREFSLEKREPRMQQDADFILILEWVLDSISVDDLIDLNAPVGNQFARGAFRKVLLDKWHFLSIRGNTVESVIEGISRYYDRVETE
jgi:hypothetical protein